MICSLDFCVKSLKSSILVMKLRLQEKYFQDFLHFTLVNNISINNSGLMCFMMENCLHFPWLRETK